MGRTAFDAEQQKTAAQVVHAAAEALAKAATRAAGLGLTVELELHFIDRSTMDGPDGSYRAQCRVAEVSVREFLPR
jgi:hypothetical protein